MDDIAPIEMIGFWYSAQGRQCWYHSTPELDQQLLSRYEGLWRRAINHELLSWENSAEGCLALVIIFDQLPLNMFRGQAKSLSSEGKAVETTYLAIERGFDQMISLEKRGFLYTPLMHSENIHDQELSVRLFTENELTESIRYALHHRDLIKEFGRFPHRNELLGRTSTAAELKYLNSKRAFKG